MIKAILIIGTFNPGAIEGFYIDGLRKQSIDIITYDIVNPYYSLVNRSLVTKVINKINPAIFYTSINKQLIEFIGKRRFDVIWVFKGMELFPETIAQLKEHTLLLVNYNADHPFIFYSPGSGNSNVLKSIQYYDLHFSYAKKIVDQLKSRFNKKAYCIPFGYDSNTKLVRETNAYDNFRNRFLFIGAYDKERAAYLNKLSYEGLDIYGDHNWKIRNWSKPYLQKIFKNKKIYDGEYVAALKSSNGVINLLREQNINEDSHNMRTFEVPGYGGVLLSQRTGEQMEYFEDGKEAIFFDSIEELRDKMDYLKKNPLLVQQIKANANKRSITSGYSYDDRSEQALSIMKDYLR